MRSFSLIYTFSIVLTTPIYTGCSITVETFGNFEGKSRLPRRNRGTLNKNTEGEIESTQAEYKVPSKNIGAKSYLTRQNSCTIKKLPRQNSGLCHILYIYQIMIVKCLNPSDECVSENCSAIYYKIHL